ESVELGALYEAAGFSRVVATPHYVPYSAWTPGVSVVCEAVADLNAAFSRKGVGVRVYAGMEIAMDSAIAWLLARGRLAGLAGTSYLLVEAPFQRSPLGWEQVCFPLLAKGHRVLLAHPERCGFFAGNPAVFDDIIGAGVFLQVNYDSFTGGYGGQAQDTALYLLGKGYVHCAATDSHDTVYRHPRGVGAAVQVIAETAGAGAADVITRQNPERVLAGKNLKAVEKNRLV
ncbi:MAG: CpsB/CapC family capsule biosynthesis tyrosine phosphatase, partial [Desulfosalsimonadaceae bacterium]